MPVLAACAAPKHSEWLETSAERGMALLLTCMVPLADWHWSMTDQAAVNYNPANSFAVHHYLCFHTPHFLGLSGDEL